MNSNKNWTLKGIWYECCRSEGQCPLWFGRDLWSHPCSAILTFQIKEGKIGDIDISGVTFIYHMGGIGPKFSDLREGVDEGAIYISDNVTNEQKNVIEPFVKTHFGAKKWRSLLGIKYVPINISEYEGTYHISMPFAEQKISLTVGGDGKNPIRLKNYKMSGFANIVEKYDKKVGNTKYWNYRDYGKNLEFHDTSGQITDFVLQGEN